MVDVILIEVYRLTARFIVNLPTSNLYTLLTVKCRRRTDDVLLCDSETSSEHDGACWQSCAGRMFCHWVASAGRPLDYICRSAAWSVLIFVPVALETVVVVVVVVTVVVELIFIRSTLYWKTKKLEK